MRRHYVDISHFRAPFKNAYLSGFGNEAPAEVDTDLNAEDPHRIRSSDWAVPTAEDIAQMIEDAESTEAVQAARRLAEDFVQSEPVKEVIAKAAEVKETALRVKQVGKWLFWGGVVYLGYRIIR